VKGINRFN